MVKSLYSLTHSPNYVRSAKISILLHASVHRIRFLVLCMCLFH